MAKKFRATGPGVKCPKCGGITEGREHIQLTDKQIHAPFYYKRWYYCWNQNCNSTTVMFDEDKVFNDNEAARTYKRRMAEIAEDLEKRRFLRSI